MWRDLTKRASHQPLGDESQPLSPGSSSCDLLKMSSKCLFGHLLQCLISSDVKRESYCLMSGVWEVVPPSGGSAGCSICVQTEAAFINLTNVLCKSRFIAWKLHIIHMKKVREEKVQHIFNEFCIFHHQPTFNETERERERWSGKLMKMSSFDICQLCEDFCLVSSAFCYANTTVSTHNGGKRVTRLTRTSNWTNFNGKKRQNTWKVRVPDWSGPFDLFHIQIPQLHFLQLEGRKNIMHNSVNGRRITQKRQETNQ